MGMLLIMEEKPNLLKEVNSRVSSRKFGSDSAMAITCSSWMPLLLTDSNPLLTDIDASEILETPDDQLKCWTRFAREEFESLKVRQILYKQLCHPAFVHRTAFYICSQNYQAQVGEESYNF